MNFDEEIAARIAKVLAEQHPNATTQEQIAQLLGVSDSSVQSYLAGGHIPDHRFLDICTRLGVSPRWLLLNEGLPVPLEIHEDVAAYGKLPKADKYVREAILRDEIRRLKQDLELSRKKAPAD